MFNNFLVKQSLNNIIIFNKKVAQDMFRECLINFLRKVELEYLQKIDFLVVDYPATQTDLSV